MFSLLLNIGTYQLFINLGFILVQMLYCCICLFNPFSFLFLNLILYFIVGYFILWTFSGLLYTREFWSFKNNNKLTYKWYIHEQWTGAACVCVRPSVRPTGDRFWHKRQPCRDQRPVLLQQNVIFEVLVRAMVLIEVGVRHKLFMV